MALSRLAPLVEIVEFVQQVRACRDPHAGQNDGSPGIGMDVARWLTERKVSLVGADSCCVEVIPNPDPTLEYPVHQELITRNGIFLMENLDLRALAADKVFEFSFVFSPTKFKGAIGSPGAPLAIR